MWLCTTRGFYSVVQHRHLPDSVLVRARVRDDLKRLLQLDAVHHPGSHALRIEQTWTRADYPYRVLMTATRWQDLVHLLTEEVTYENFKSAVKDEGLPGHAQVFMSVWDDLRRLERLDAGLYPPYYEAPE